MQAEEWQIARIAAMKGATTKELMYATGLKSSCVNSYKVIFHGKCKERMSTFARHKKILAKVEANPGILEHIEGEMEFNLTRYVLVRDCAIDLCLTQHEVQHCLYCLVSPRARKRWQQANKKKKVSSRFK